MVSKQFIPTKALSGSQSSPTLLNKFQDTPTLSSFYLGLMVVYLY